jgi:hypothetical protein
MRFFNAIFALSFIAAVVGTPVPAAEKRAPAPTSSTPLDLVSVLGDLKTKIVSPKRPDKETTSTLTGSNLPLTS